jgi:large subunit ribosomal protein L20
MTRRRLVRVAKQAYLHAGEYAFAGRKNRKRDFRRTWISRISHAVSLQGLSYSVFINKVKQSKIALDRKIMAYLVTEKPDVFSTLVDKVK